MPSSRTRSLKALPVITLLALALAACGDAGSSGTTAPEDVEGEGCAPVAGTAIVALEDDKHLQNADNIVAAINKDAGSEAVLAATNKVAQTLDTAKLIQLNKAVDIDRQTPEEAAEAFADANGLKEGLSGGSGEIVVGHANFSESQILAELYRIALEAAGFDAETQDSGNRELYEPALERGEIQVFPEYAATLAEFLNAQVNGENAEPVASSDLTATMGELAKLAEERGLVVGDPSAAADTNAFAVTKEFAEQHGIATLSDFAAKCSGKASILGGPPECPERPFCQIGLEQTYGIQFGQFKTLDVATLSEEGLKNGTVTISTVLSTSGSLAVS